MDLKTRKIEFVQEFLKLQSEEIVTLLENVLKKQTITTKSESFTPTTVTELNARIDKSEEDFKNGRYSTSQELLSKYE
ncbi:hypothetical protein [Flavobacterium litorale]|uniref:Uncharacterized protein n=1 Tax=Flavobacterium litorale TaxID=2856519 RepID=A0ABX8V863_9FLAO|nr:hypothetical protein [Flavobacterium litorale]QYJ69045.1 hypothetical protein K1I41_03925 [Flavobacterium litorale]